MLLKACLAKLTAVLGQYEAETIILHSLGQEDRSYLFNHGYDVLSDEALIMAYNILRRRQECVPLAYILGYCYFYDLRLSLNRNCLVPRPDTELLVDVALERLRFIDEQQAQATGDNKVEHSLIRCLDLGTGSGAIILALKHQFATIDAVGLDICPKALAVAQRNGVQLGLPVKWQQGHWAELIPADSFDCIVSNPPYVAYSELSYMNAETSEEPVRALFASSHGLAEYRIILRQAYGCLKSQGWLCVEHGFQQASALAALFVLYGYSNIQQFQDYGGHDRVTIGQKCDVM